MHTSVVIVTHNGRPYLENCLRSVLAEVGRDGEVIVVDNASTDGAPDWVAGRCPGVVLVRNAANVGYAAACNQGARTASGEVLVFLNQDTVVRPGWLDALSAPLLDDSDVALTTSQVLLMSRPGRVQLCGQDVHYTGLVFARGFLAPASSMAAAEEVGAVSGSSFAVRREVWDALDGLDETMFMYYEETDLSWRARLAGYRSWAIPASILLHDYRPGQANRFQLYHSMRNRRLMLYKNWRWATLLLLPPGLLVAELLEWALALSHGWVGVQAKARADLWLVTHLRQIGRLHAQAQALRQVSDAEILAERTWRVEPQEMALGPVGRVVIAACNAFFRLHYALARWCCAAMGV